MLRAAFICILCCWSIKATAQDPQEFEQRICKLLEKTSGYENIAKVVELIEWESDIIENIPCISPIEPPDFRQLRVSSPYGLRYHPILQEYRHHSGIDIPAHMGDTVYCSATGKVLAAGFDALLGNYIKVHHRFGFVSTYGHLSRILVQSGDSLTIGNIIGLVGSTGRSTGPHLHYGIRKNGREENAYPYCFLLVRIMLKSQRKEKE